MIMKVYGKTVTPVQLTDDMVSECQDPHVPPSTGRYGVIVHRSDRDYPEIHRCNTTEYRDDTLVYFHAYYDTTDKVETFGPDVEV